MVRVRLRANRGAVLAQLLAESAGVERARRLLGTQIGEQRAGPGAIAARLRGGVIPRFLTQLRASLALRRALGADRDALGRVGLLECHRRAEATRLAETERPRHGALAFARQLSSDRFVPLDHELGRRHRPTEPRRTEPARRG